VTPPAPGFAHWLWRHGSYRAATAASALIVLATAALVAPAHAQETAQAQLRLDFNIENGGGPCAVIDQSAILVPGATTQVAVCLSALSEPPAGVRFTLLYDDRVVRAPNVGLCDGNLDEGQIASVEESLDCNPDANAGQTTFGPAGLGEGWDCSSGIVEPWGQREGVLTGEAFNGGCVSIAGPYTLPPSAPVALVTFEAVAPGRAPIFPAIVQITGSSEALPDLGSCQPAVDNPMQCVGGIILVGEEEEPVPPADEGGGGGRRWLWIAVGAVIVVVAAGVGVAAWRRPQP
jgi:hypothetical protein